MLTWYISDIHNWHTNFELKLALFSVVLFFVQSQRQMDKFSTNRKAVHKLIEYCSFNRIKEKIGSDLWILKEIDDEND